jgi:hypothetical protein
MSEIFALLNNSTRFSVDVIKQQFETGMRPPNLNYTTENVMIKALFGGRTTNPPITIKDIAIICDGTIYNSEKLFKELDIEPETDYGYEIIVHLYIRYGIENTLQLLDGDFVFALLDHRLVSPSGELDSIMYIARDPYGVKPFYLLRPNSKNIMIEYNRTDGDIYALSSNIDALTGFEREMNLIEHPDNDLLIIKGKPKKKFYVIDSILPGSYSVFEQKFRVMASWRFIKHQIPYHTCQLLTNPVSIDNNRMLNQLVQEAVVKRIRDKPISIIFTGNYEGFINAAIVKDKEHPVNTFSWSDTIYEKEIQLVSNYLNTNHTVVSATDSDIEKEEENIDPEFADHSRLWIMAKNVAKIAPNSTVFLEIGIDDVDSNFVLNPTDESRSSYLDFQYRLQNYFKSVCVDRLNKISKVFWYHGLDVEISWLDHALVQHIVNNYSRNVGLVFNPIGVYGNKLLPEELFH